MPRQRVQHVYHVLVTSYATEDIQGRVERGEVFITQPGQLSSELFYLGASEAQAERAFYRAVRKAMQSPLAFRVTMWRGNQVLVRVSPERE